MSTFSSEYVKILFVLFNSAENLLATRIADCDGGVACQVGLLPPHEYVSYMCTHLRSFKRGELQTGLGLQMCGVLSVNTIIYRKIAVKLSYLSLSHDGVHINAS